MSSLDKQSADILIITALAEELESIRTIFNFEDTSYSSDTPLIYNHSSIPTLDGKMHYSVATTCLFGMGNPDSAALTAGAIRDINPKYIVMFGIAGGIRSRVELGDVIVSTRIFYYEQAKQRSDNVEIRPNTYPVDAFLKNRLENFASQQKRAYSIKFGPFAVGEKIVADQALVNDLQLYEPKLLGVEMESFGVVSAASYSVTRPRFIAIRGVSDHADMQKDDNWRQTALQNAADFFLDFLSSGTLPNYPTSTNTASSVDNIIAIHHLSLYRQPSIKSAIQSRLSEYASSLICELKVDQTDIFQNGTLPDPRAAFSRQQDFRSKLDELLNEHPDAKIGYFGLAHVPLIFHLGYLINRCEVRLFVTDRQSGQWKPLQKEAESWPTLFVEGMPKSKDNSPDELVIRVSVSYPVLMEQVNPNIVRSSISVHLTLERPLPDVVTSEPQLNDYASVFYETLVNLQNLRPNARAIHVFFSGPPPLAFRYGQQISTTVDSDVFVYNYSKYDQPNYGWALNLRSREILELRNEE